MKDPWINEDGVILGPPTKSPVYRVFISGSEVFKPERVDTTPFAESGWTSLRAPTYECGQVYNFYNYWLAHRFYLKRLQIYNEAKRSE